MRADARRNRDRLLSAAETAFAEHGIDVALEDVARRAGLGIGTLYRHFASRAALLEALVVREHESRLATAQTLLASDDPAAALVDWLAQIQRFSARYRGLAAALAVTCSDESSPLHATSHTTLELTSQLLARTHQARAVRPDVTPDDLFDLVTGITIAAEQTAGTPARAERLLHLALGGILTTNPEMSATTTTGP